MRKITKEAVEAFWGDTFHFLPGNTMVARYSETGVEMFLHGNLIASRDEALLSISSCGWKTPTTKERLNGVLLRMWWQIRQCKGECSVYNSQTEESVLFYDGMQFRI